VDLAKAHVKALAYLMEAETKRFDVVNLGTGKGTSVLEIIKTFEEVNNLKLNYEIGPRREGDVEQIYANATKSKEVLGWECQFSLKDALKHSWEWEQGIENLD
jgi:UDP-glucose 4-epimerase